MFKALVLRDESPEDDIQSSLESLEVDDLPNDGDVLVRVEWSGINYKDALAVTGEGKIVRADYPFVPGIDLAGVVMKSEDERFEEGDRVLQTGWGLGERVWGGYSQVQRVRADWLVPVPDQLTLRDAMVAGTAGFTGILSALTIEESETRPGGDPVVVTGATGGVGSFAVMALARMGYDVAASTGKTDEIEYLEDLGASSLLPRDVLADGARQPLDSARWGGAVDVVGGKTLEALVSQMGRHGTIAACGLAGGHELHTTVFPFILRGVRLIGIDSNTCPHERRLQVWSRICQLAEAVDMGHLAKTVPLAEVPERCRDVLNGRVMGRLVVSVS